MARISRKRRRPAAQARPAEQSANGAPPPPKLRGEARNEAIRAQLVPLAPGERPLPLKIGAALLGLLGAAALVLRLSGFDARDTGYFLGLLAGSPGGSRNDAFFVPLVLFLFGMAAGLWFRQAWAVLGLQMILGVLIVYASIALAVTASNVVAVVYCLAIIVGAGWLFWKHVRILARIQMPSDA